MSWIDKILSLVLWYVAILCYCRYTWLQVLQGNRDIFATVTCHKYVLMARGQSPRDSGATNSAVHFHRGSLSNPLIHFQTHGKPCLWAAQRPVSDCTVAFMASRGGGDLLDQIGISNQRARSPVLWMWYGEKIKGKPTHSFWTLFPKLFLSLKKKNKKNVCVQSSER